MVEDDAPNRADTTHENVNSEGYINYAQKVPRKKLEELANVLLGPLIENRDLFSYRDLSHTDAVEMLDFWNVWLRDICQTATEFEWFRHLSIPSEIILPGCTESAARITQKFDSLSEAEQTEIRILKNELDQADDILREKQTIAIQKRSEATRQIDEELFEDFFDQDRNASVNLEDFISTKAAKRRIIDLKKAADESLADETTKIVCEYEYTCEDILIKMESVLGFNPSDYFFGDPWLKLIEDIGILPRVQYAMELHRRVLYDLAHGHKSVFTSGLNQKRGRPKDPLSVKMLKDRVGVTYRAIRKIGASQKEALTAINDVLKEGGIPLMMEPDAIRKRASQSLVLPRYLIPSEYGSLIDANGQLIIRPGKTRHDMLKHIAHIWLFSYMRDALRSFGK